MGNMSYCRFRNTKGDLEDCIGKLEELIENETNPKDGLSLEERGAMMGMKYICEQFIDLVSEAEELDLEDVKDEA